MALIHIVAVTALFLLSQVRSGIGERNPEIDVANASEAKVAKRSSTSANILHEIFEKCANQHMLPCLKMELITELDNALGQSNNIEILSGVDIVPSTSDEKSESDKQSTRSFKKRQSKNGTLNSMIMDRVISWMQSKTLRVMPPNPASFAYGFSDESRKKKDKKQGGALIMIPLLLGGTFIPLAYGALAFLAGKALIVSKLALVLASIVGIKKLLSGGSAKEQQHEVFVSGGHAGGSDWGRDFEEAYRGYRQNITDNEK